MRFFKFLSVAFLTFILGSFTTKPDAPELRGVWVRKSDDLRITIKEEDQSKLFSFIIDEGIEKFPCEVSALPIYKNIVHIKQNLWSCDFLVVTMGSCSIDYEEGYIQINEDNEMVITCPGFDKKVYTKLKPRYGEG